MIFYKVIKISNQQIQMKIINVLFLGFEFRDFYFICQYTFNISLRVTHAKQHLINDDYFDFSSKG